MIALAPCGRSCSTLISSSFVSPQGHAVSIPAMAVELHMPTSYWLLSGCISGMATARVAMPPARTRSSIITATIYTLQSLPFYRMKNRVLISFQAGTQVLLTELLCYGILNYPSTWLEESFVGENIVWQMRVLRPRKEAHALHVGSNWRSLFL